MDKIGKYTDTANSDDEFTEGNPSDGVPATEVPDDWLNAVQRELIEAITKMGISLDTDDDTLLWRALKGVYGKTYDGDPNGKVAANVKHERCWDTSASPAALYVATEADGTTDGTTWKPAGAGTPYRDDSADTRHRLVVVDGVIALEEI